jgi:tetratricopeptide (TPR) repeat protein
MAFFRNIQVYGLRTRGMSCFLTILLLGGVSLAQIDEAREAIDRGEYVRAVNILSETLANRPDADAYLYLGIAYRHMKEYQKAEDTFTEGSKRYPDDPRFHNELANLFLENNSLESARSALRRALVVDPNNNYASDQLATLDMSTGDVQAALRSWNKSGRPVINDILNNYYPSFSSWVVRRGITFHPGRTLRYSEWKTTESRLFETDNFTNVGLELEPTRIVDRYNAVVRTTTKTNSPADILFGLVKGLPFQTSYLDLWNLDNSGINFNGLYRWDADRRRGGGGFKIPLPIAGLLSLEFGSLWRFERWNLSPTIRPELLPKARLIYKDTAMGIGVTHIPYYRVELAAGFLYRNRAASGELPQVYTNSLNTGKFTAGVNLYLIDRKYQNQLRLEAFAARRSIIGNTQFTGGTAELDNRVTLSKDTGTYFDWTVKGGTSRGLLPIEDYFVLGIDAPTTANLLRGHRTTLDGQYGKGPIGSDFVLLNTDFNRRLKTIPFFNTLNIPYFVVKGDIFFDAAKTWDRNDVFKPSKLLLDTGVGLRFETPTYSFNLIYGKSLRDGNNVWTAYYTRRLWLN